MVGGGGSTRIDPANATQLQHLDRESAARSFGNDRFNDFHSSSRMMYHSFGGGAFHRR